MSEQIAIAGVSGRMGVRCLKPWQPIPVARCARRSTVLAARWRTGAGAAWGGASNVHISDQPAVALQGAQALIDFTRPEATAGYLDACVAAKLPWSSAPPASMTPARRTLPRLRSGSPSCLRRI